ncbi:MAG: transporter related protein, partial [Planctomycetaceae bacterium]|nr:transporter related protein [Planctomycetaceae bacterium]
MRRMPQWKILNSDADSADTRATGTARLNRIPLRSNRVTGSVLLAGVSLIFLISATGCEGLASGQQLSVREMRHWMLPSEGTRVPAPRAVHAAKNGELYVLDNAGRVLVFDPQGKLRRQWWMPEYSVGKPEKICL